MRRSRLLSILILCALLLSGCGSEQAKPEKSKIAFDVSELPEKSVTAGGEPEETDGAVSGETVDVDLEISAQTRAEETTLKLTLNEKLGLMVSGYEDITKMVRFFPGGDSLEKGESVGELPISHDSLMTLRGEISELYPDLEAGGEGRIMMNHTCYPRICTELEPAFMSYTIVTSILREELGFNGVIYTPSLCDGQLRSRYMVDTDEHLAVEAVKAGCDVVYQPRSKKKAIEALRTEVLGGGIDEDRINASVVRIIENIIITGVDFYKIADFIET